MDFAVEKREYSYTILNEKYFDWQSLDTAKKINARNQICINRNWSNNQYLDLRLVLHFFLWWSFPILPHFFPIPSFAFPLAPTVDRFLSMLIFYDHLTHLKYNEINKAKMHFITIKKSLITYIISSDFFNPPRKSSINPVIF